jgi:cytoskeleton protein RodZ
MKRTGQLLRETRETQGISLNAVSAATKISVKVLEAIESGDLGQLPPKTFVRGFVQTYAMFLKLDPKAVLDLFQEEVGTTRYNPVIERPEGSEEVPTPNRPRPTPSTNSMAEKPAGGLTKWLLGGLALMLVVAIYFVAQTVQKYKRESEVSQFPPEVRPEEELLASPSPSTGASNANTVTPTDTPSGSPIASPVAGAVAASPEASTSPSPSPSQSPSPSPTPTPSPSPTASPTPAPTPPPQDVTIEALDTVKITFSLDGGASQSLTLQPEQKKKFSAKQSFSAEVSDGGAISIIHNGKDKGVPGNLGQPIQLSFPPKE